MTYIHPEADLLLCCTRVQLDPPTIDRIKTLLQSPLDWENLISLAQQHLVLPLLYKSLNQVAPHQVPADRLQWLAEQFQANRYRNLVLTQELVRLVQLLQAHGIVTLPFKGPLLTVTLYGDLGLRHISDLDLLVPEADFQTATNLLMARGYELRNEVRWECHLKQVNGIVNVDLHREAVPTHLSYPLRNDYWWTHQTPVQIAGTTLPNLPPEALLLMLCLNGTKDRWLMLHRICDVAELIRRYPNLDWQSILRHAEQLGLKRLIALSLTLAVQLLEAPLPAEIWQTIQADRTAQTLALQVCQDLFSGQPKPYREVLRTVFHMRTRERLSDRIYSFIGLMNHSGWLTPTEKDRELLPLPEALSWIYYLIRPIRVAGRYGLGPLKQLVIGR